MVRNDIRRHRNDNFCNSFWREDLFPFFIRPSLKIEFDNPKKPDVNTFRPSHQIQATQHDKFVIGEKVTRIFLKVRVRNNGKDLATNCEGELRILSWSDSVKIPPSTDCKKLSWDEIPSTNSLQRNIRIKKDGELLTIIFVDSRLKYQKEVEDGNIFAHISTDEALISMRNKLQDGLRKGDYVALLTVTSENGAYTQKKIKIHVDREYGSVTLSEIKPTLVERLKNRFSR